MEKAYDSFTLKLDQFQVLFSAKGELRRTTDSFVATGQLVNSFPNAGSLLLRHLQFSSPLPLTQCRRVAM